MEYAYASGFSRHFNKNKNDIPFPIGKTWIAFKRWDHCRSQMFNSPDIETRCLDQTMGIAR